MNKKDRKNIEEKLDEIEKSLLTTLKENLNSMIEKEAPRINDVLSTRVHENSQDEYFIKKAKKIASAATSLTKHNAIAAELKAGKHIGKLRTKLVDEHNRAVLNSTMNDTREVWDNEAMNRQQIRNDAIDRSRARRNDD